MRSSTPLRSSALSLVVGALVVSAVPVDAQGGDPAPSGRISFDVMTFNIRTSGGRDGSNAWPNRKELVAQTIGRFAPHLVGLQEALAEQISFLEDALPEYRWLGVDRGLNGGVGLSEATPIFYRYRELLPIESGTFWLTETPDRPSRGRRGGRIVTWARFHHLETGRQIYVYNTHFTLRRGPRQRRSAEAINARIAKLPEGSAVVVMGDFNAVAESSETWRIATGEGMVDTWLVAREREGPPLTSNGFAAPPPGWEGRIDWILVSRSVEVARVETVVNSVGGRYPSDHYPVVARLEVDPN